MTAPKTPLSPRRRPPSPPWLALLALLLGPGLAAAQGAARGAAPAGPPRGSRVLNLEAETLAGTPRAVLSAGGGKVVAQPMASFGPGWSGNAQLLWTGGQPGAVLDLLVDVDVAALYAVEIYLTRGPDYGQVKVQVEGRDSLVTFTGFAPRAMPGGPQQAGKFSLATGPRKVSFLILPRLPQSTGNLVGIDRIRLYPVGPPEPTGAVSASAAGAGAAAKLAGSPSPERLGLRTTLEMWTGLAGPLDAHERPYAQKVSVNPANVVPGWWFRWSTTYGGGASAVIQALRSAPGAAEPPLSPPGLIGKQPVPGPVHAGGQPAEFQADIRPWVQAASGSKQRGAPALERFYLRLVLLDAQGKPVGSPSPPVEVALPRGGAVSSPSEVIAGVEAAQKKEAEMAKQAQVYDLKIVDYAPAVLPDPNLVGCVQVLKNPFYGQAVHPLAGYQPGHRYCPPPNPAFQDKGALGTVGDVLSAFVKVWDLLSGFVANAKAWVASKLVSLIPCEALGTKAGKICEAAASQLVGLALSAGMVAAGVPPVLTNLPSLDDLAEGKVAEAAVDFTCDAAAAHDSPCSALAKSGLQAAYKAGLDKLRQEAKKSLTRQTQEPNCGDSREVKESGRIPLPCFTDFPGAEVKPAKGAAYQPPVATLRVTRTKPDPGFPLARCAIATSMDLKNQFPGGYIGGKNLPPAPLHDEPFVPVETGIPRLQVGQSKTFQVSLSRMRPITIPGDYDSSFDMGKWLWLYIGGKGTLSSGFVATETVTLPDGSQVKVPAGRRCGTGDTRSVEIPRT